MVDYVGRNAIFSREARSNPQAVYERMRTEAPVFSEVGPISGFNFWFLTRYDDCVAALKDPRIGKEIRKHVPPHMLDKYQEPQGFFKAIDRHLLNFDPPDHTRLRGLVHKAFTPRIIEDLRPRIQAISEELLAAVQGQSAMDLIGGFGFPLPIIVISELLGVPAENRDQFRAWTKLLL